MGYIDLHVHTTYSDGMCDVKTVIAQAKKNNVKVLSLTEHYNLSSFPLACLLANNEIEIIPGLELGTDTKSLGIAKKSKCHLLIYYPSVKILDILDEYETSRKNCVTKILQKLNHIIHISVKDVKKFSRNPESIGRFDIALALYYLGYSRTPQQAYTDFLDINNTCYCERQKPTPFDMLIKLKNIGGVACLAHPRSLRMSYRNLYYFVRELKQYGLKGIEVYNSHHKINDIVNLLSICQNLDLIPLVGSDYHGRKNDNIEIGTGINNNLCISNYEIIDKLKASI